MRRLPGRRGATALGHRTDAGVDGQVGVLVFVRQHFLVNRADGGDHIGREAGTITKGIGETGGQVILVEILEVGLVRIHFVEAAFGFPPDAVGQLTTVEGAVAQTFVVELPILVHIHVGGETTHVLASVQCLLITVFRQSRLKSQPGGERQSRQSHGCFHVLPPSGINGLQCNHWNIPGR